MAEIQEEEMKKVESKSLEEKGLQPGNSMKSSTIEEEKEKLFLEDLNRRGRSVVSLISELISRKGELIDLASHLKKKEEPKKKF